MPHKQVNRGGILRDARVAHLRQHPTNTPRKTPISSARCDMPIPEVIKRFSKPAKVTLVRNEVFPQRPHHLPINTRTGDVPTGT